MKNVLITGASMGIGEQLAKGLGKKDVHLYLVARSEAKLNEIAHDIGEEKCTVIVQDLLAEDAVDCVLEHLKDVEIDILINNAGFGDYGKFSELSLSKAKRMIALNVTVLTELCYKVIPTMKKGSKVLNVASVASFQGGPYFAVYAATKAYVLSLSEALREEYLGMIDVSALCPGPTHTNFAKTAQMDTSIVFEGAFAMSAFKVAKEAIKGLEKNVGIIIPGLGNKLMILGSKYLPRIVSRKVIAWVRHFS